MEKKRKLLTVVMDGVGLREDRYGNAVALAGTPYLNWLQQSALFTTIRAHGTAVGLPSDSDIGNSEVGHNALGAGSIYDQGAKLVNKAIDSESVYDGKTWQELIKFVKSGSGVMHFLGLLSDGNVHSHEKHLYSLMARAFKEGVKTLRVHVLLDGRDVPPRSAEKYVENLSKVMADMREAGCDVKVASAGGRMVITMDRYGADWEMVSRGWQTHVLGEGPSFKSLDAALAEFRKDAKLTDQNIPGFVIADENGPVGPIGDGDGVVFFNFRGDRAIEISRAFSEKDFSEFERGRLPNVYYTGMMEYDGDEHVPNNYLVSPPAIIGTMGERLAELGLRQFACSETQKYGHVTFFWNGNRSGYFDPKIEEYLEIPSDNLSFNLKPWMKAYEITEAVIERMNSGSFDFGRINYPNGDMVGHTGDLDATIIAVATVDMMLGRLIHTAKKTNTILVVTADHGNADQMFEGSSKKFPDWETLAPDERPTCRTAHTLSEVPFYVYDPCGSVDGKELWNPSEGTLANFANTSFELMGLPSVAEFEPSLLRV